MKIRPKDPRDRLERRLEYVHNYHNVYLGILCGVCLIQPWASLIVDGRKGIETRSWGTKYRGTLAIHASMKVDRAACSKFGYNSKIILKGYILGTAEVVDCVQFPNPRAPPDVYGDFAEGRFGWFLTDIVKFPMPVPAKGHLGLWEWAPIQESG